MTKEPRRIPVSDRRRSAAGSEPAAGGDAPAPVTHPNTQGSLRGAPPSSPDEPDNAGFDDMSEVVEGEVLGPADPPHQDDEERDYLDDLRRLQADFENYKKRMMRQAAETGTRAKAGVIERLLPVLDNFERAISHGEGGEGVALVYKEFLGALHAEGLQEIPAEGVAFDPRVHEAVDAVFEEGLEEEIARTVYQRGYRLGEQVLRPARVVVARPAEEG